MKWKSKYTPYVHKKKTKREEGLEDEIDGKDGYVYIFSLGHDQMYKIGHTKNILNRLKLLQASNPKLKCVWSAMVNDRYALEAKLHKIFHNKRVEREIFILDTEDMKRANAHALHYQ